MNTLSHARPASSLLRAVRRRPWFVALYAVLVAAAVLAYSLAQEKQYRASASLLLDDSDPLALVDGSSSAPSSQRDARRAGTDLSLASGPVVASRTARRLGIAAVDVASRVDVGSAASTELATVRATDASPVVAARLANTYAEELIRLRRTAAIDDVRRAEAVLRTRLRSINRRLGALQPTGEGARRAPSARAAERLVLVDERDSLVQRQGDLGSLASATTGNIELAHRAEPPGSPISPKPLRNAVIGLGFGVVLGVALALLFDMLDRRVRDSAEVAALVDLPLLATIPRSRALADQSDHSVLAAAESHAFHMLRTSLRYYDDNRDLRSVVITSAGPRDGKTSVAWNLAAVSAQVGESVLLVEADLRQPSLAARCRVPPDWGLSEVVQGRATFDDVLNELVVPRRVNGSAAPYTLDLIVAGAPNGGVSRLLESEGMDRLITQAKERYDLVVVDTPPVSVVPDAIPLMIRADGVVVVARLGHTTRDALSFLDGQLRRIGATALGTVVNGVARQSRNDDASYDVAEPRLSDTPVPEEVPVLH